VELIVTDDEWSPYLSLQDTYKLDDVHEALRRGDLERASKIARVFTMQPIAIQLLKIAQQMAQPDGVILSAIEARKIQLKI